MKCCLVCPVVSVDLLCCFLDKKLRETVGSMHFVQINTVYIGVRLGPF